METGPRSEPSVRAGLQLQIRTIDKQVEYILTLPRFSSAFVAFYGYLSEPSLFYSFILHLFWG